MIMVPTPYYAVCFERFLIFFPAFLRKSHCMVLSVILYLGCRFGAFLVFIFLGIKPLSKSKMMAIFQMYCKCPIKSYSDHIVAFFTIGPPQAGKLQTPTVRSSGSVSWSIFRFSTFLFLIF